VGGLEGRALKPGDILPAGRLSGAAAVPAGLPADWVPAHGPEINLKVMLGPQDDLFAEEGLHTFFESSYVVSLEADRMGYRLDGPKIQHRGPADIISEALPEGAVQVPAHGRPIVMMADRQTTGGYPIIATVIGPCLPLLAQARPGDRVRFQRSSDAEAVAALHEEEERYHLIQRFLDLNLHSHRPQEA
jgi:allophanate hydrolase subunit 2